MSRPLRIVATGISHETNTFTPLPTGFDDFVVSRDPKRYAPDPSEAEQLSGVEVVPNLLARAQPGGLVLRDAYERLKAALLAELATALPCDGLLLDLHGAMEIEQLGDGETDLLHAVRKVVGEDMPIAVSLDLHANIGPALVERVDIVTAYRTAPHRDERATRRRALRLLAHALTTGRRPVAALVKLPLLLAGEAAVTDVEPARSLYARLEQLARAPGVLDASLLIGCAWTDSPYATVSAVVVAESDAGLAQRQALELASEVWKQRERFVYGAETMQLDAAVAAALGSAASPTYISDSGDNVTAGAPGDSPVLLGRLLDAGARDALVAGLVDAPAVQACAAAGVGATIRLSIGATLAPRYSSAVVCDAVVERVNYSPDMPDATSAVVRIDGVRAILTGARQAFTERAHIAAAGVDLDAQRIVVVKLGYLFPDLAAHAARALVALSPGATTLRLDALPYRRLPRPIYPLDPSTSWA